MATAAGVSRPTVTAVFGSRPALLSAAIDEALAGDDEPAPVSARAWLEPVWQAQTSTECLAAYAEVCTVIGKRAAPLFEVLRRSADSTPELVDLWTRTQGNRRRGAEMVIDRVREIGDRRQLPERDRAVNILWFYSDPSHYLALVHHCRWDDPAFTAWLTKRMTNALLSTD